MNWSGRSIGLEHRYHPPPTSVLAEVRKRISPFLSEVRHPRSVTRVTYPSSLSFGLIFASGFNKRLHVPGPVSVLSSLRFGILTP